MIRSILRCAMALLAAGGLLVLPAAAAVPDISSKRSHTVALDIGGQVYSWGSDTDGQLGLDRKLFESSPRLVNGIPAMRTVSAGTNHVVAIDNSFNVWTWGGNVFGQLGRRLEANDAKPARVLGVSNVVAVAAGQTFTIALRSDGTVYVWGSTFGTGTYSPNARVVPGLTGIVRIAAGDGHVVALKSDGTVWTAGANAWGQVGDGTTAPRLVPYQIPVNTGVSSITHIAAGYGQTVVRKSDGTVYAWGSNFPQAVGRVTPQPVAGITDAVSVAAGQLSFAVRSNGTLLGWGNTYTPAPYSTFGGLRVPSVVEPDPVTVSAGATGFTVYGITTGGGILAQGGNVVGQLGIGATGAVTSVVQVSGGVTGVTHVSAGDRFVAARRSNGEVYVWGSNAQGQVSDSDDVATSLPRLVPGFPVNADVVEVKAGTEFTLARDATGIVYGWGRNDVGQIGNGSGTPRAIPAAIAGLSNVVEMAVGCNHALFRTGGGTVFVLGSVGGTSGTPTAVPGISGATHVSAGCGTAFVVSPAGVHAWGLNSRGQLGNGTTTDVAQPTLLPSGSFGGLAVTQIAIQQDHGLARTTDSTVWSWGYNSTGQLGDGTTTQRATPARVPGLTGIVAVAAGFTHSLALAGNSTDPAVKRVFSWGSNRGGELGDGTTVARLSPVAVQVLNDIERISAGQGLSFAVRKGGTVWGWGADVGATLPRGATGDGTYAIRSRPALVLRELEGDGNLDGNKWFLDLDPPLPDAVPAAAVRKIVPVVKVYGAAENISLTAGINFRLADYGKRVNTYILGYVPAAFLSQVTTAPSMSKLRLAELAAADEPVLVQLTPAGWATVTGQLIAYTSAVINANGGANNILNGVNPNTIPGARFCIGYGESGTSMLTAESLGEVLTLEGATSTAGGLPCVLTGAYISGPASSNAGSPVTLTATVVGLSPSGTVQLVDNLANLGAPMTLTLLSEAVGSASFTTSALAAGVHSIGVNYLGDAQNPASAAGIPLLHVVSPATTGTTTSLGGPASSVSGEQVTLTATVFGNNPGGTVQFKDGAANLGAAVPVADGVATLSTDGLVLGAHTITAVYGGDTGSGGPNTGSTSNAISHTVYAAITTAATLTTSLSPASLGTPVTLTATVTGNNPTGTVAFKDGPATFATVALVNGTASTVVAAFAAGLHTLTVDYSGDANNQVVSSPALFQQVNAVLDPAADSDQDGIPNGVEATEGTNPLVKDNDVFTNARLFAMQQYRDFLNREGDAGGITGWTGFINGGGTRATVVEGFFSSAEFQGTISPVARLYFAYFLRVPDYAGLQFWINFFRAGNPLSAISDAFAGSPEFVSRYGALDNTQFVTLVYQNVLGRAPDAGGLAFWVGQLNGGMSRGTMMIGFSESAEYIAAIRSEVNVTMTYVGMLRRAPDAGGFAFWVPYLDSGNSQQALINGFLGAPEYRARFLP